MPASIFAGSKVKTLKGTLSLNGGADVISSTTDPTSVAVDASPGSILLNTTSGKQYRKNDSGSSTNWTEVGSGTSGINYITNPSASTNTTGWSTYADAAGAQPVDGTGGSPTVTWTRSTTTPLRGAADFNFTKDAANRQGEGVATDITIDLADRAKVLTVTFDYEVLSGTYASGDLTVYLIADPTGTPVVIQPAGYTVQSATVGTTMRQIATFQTQATGQSYRVCFHVASTSASAYVVAVDNVICGPQSTVQGAAINDWASFTPTISTSTGAVSNATPTALWRRVGSDLEVVGSITFSAASSAFTDILVTVPSGISIDTTKTLANKVGYATSYDNGTSFFLADVLTNNASRVIIYGVDASISRAALTNITNLNPFTFNANDTISFSYKVPVVGWSSNTVLSQDTDTRVVAFTGSFISTSIATGTLDTAKIIAPGSSQDTHGAYATGLGTYTVPVSGFYKITHQNSLALEVSKSFRVGYTINSTTAFTKAAIINNGSASFSVIVVNTCSGIEKLNAGDIIRFAVSHDNASATSLTNDSRFQVYTIERLSGPATIAASETVGCTFNTLTANTVTAAGIDLIYTNKVFDTHGSYNTSNGEYSVPVSGEYTISGQYRASNTAMTVGFGTTIFVRIDGTLVNYLALIRTQTASGIIREVSGAPVTLRLNAGQKIKLGASSDTNTALDTSTSGIQTQFNWMSIMRTGN